MAKLRESVPFIEKRDKVEDELKELYNTKKATSKNLPKLLEELKGIQKEIVVL